MYAVTEAVMVVRFVESPWRPMVEIDEVPVPRMRSRTSGFLWPYRSRTFFVTVVDVVAARRNILHSTGAPVAVGSRCDRPVVPIAVPYAVRSLVVLRVPDVSVVLLPSRSDRDGGTAGRRR